MKRIIIGLALLSILVLSGCVSDIPEQERKDFCEDVGMRYIGDYNQGAFSCKISDVDYVELKFTKKEECPKPEEQLKFFGKGEWKFFNSSKEPTEIPNFEEDCKEVTCDCAKGPGPICLAKCYRC